MVQKRNYGVEMLRIVSMMMIILLHYFNFGGGLHNCAEGTASWYLVWLCEAICFCSVNCYVLISGYFQSASTSKRGISKIVKLEKSIWFYSFFIMIIFGALGIYEWSLGNVFSYSLPVLTKKYWFVTVYICIYALSPYFNLLINTLKKTDMEKMLGILLLFFSIIPSVIPYKKWTLIPEGGYNVVWFVCLYFVGAYLRLYYDNNKLKNNRYIIIYVVCIFFVWFSKILFKITVNYITVLNVYGEAFFYEYNNVFVFLSSVMLFLLFKEFDFKSMKINKFIKIIGSCSFAVYLIHAHPMVNEVVWRALHTDRWYETSAIVIHAVGCAVCIYGGCMTIELIRRKVFTCLEKVFNRKQAMKSQP